MVSGDQVVRNEIFIIMVLRVIEWVNLLHLPLFGKEGLGEIL